MSRFRRAVPAVLAVVLAGSGLTVLAAPVHAGVPVADKGSDDGSATGEDLGSDWGDGAVRNSSGRMVPKAARTTTVNPASGPDFELPFVCGQRWIGSSRSGHSPSYYSIDWNTSNDLGRPALASAPGVVVTARSLSGSYGRYIVVDHGHGYTTLYGHLNQIVATVGTYVDQGDLLGYVGSSGNSTGPHLHFEERLNGAYFAPYFHRARFRINSTATSTNCTDRPITGDWNGDRRTEVGIYRTATTGGQFFKRVGTSTSVILYGRPGDTGFTGDWEGNRVTDVGNRALGTSRFTTRAGSGATYGAMSYGVASDIPVTGDWNGNRSTDPGVFRAASHLFCLRRPDGATTAVSLGSTGDRPVSGDWNGDGKTDIGVFSPSTGYWTLRVPSGSSYTLQKVGYGQSSDIPITGDWNGDGKWEIGVWRPSTAQFILRAPTSVSGRYVNRVQAMGFHR